MVLAIQSVSPEPVKDAGDAWAVISGQIALQAMEGGNAGVKAYEALARQTGRDPRQNKSSVTVATKDGSLSLSDVPTEELLTMLTGNGFDNYTYNNHEDGQDTSQSMNPASRQGSLEAQHGQVVDAEWNEE